MTRKTKFVYTKIPDTAQYKRADWSGHVATESGTSLEDAKARAEKDDSISYFFHMKRGMVLERPPKPSRRFSSGDAVFFSGKSLFLGSAPGFSDTYLVAEVYDMSDAATKDSILGELRQGFLLTRGVDASRGTPAAPQTVTAGWVFVAFNDVAGGDIPSLRTKLEGTGETSLTSFIERESNGRVDLKVETYTPPGGSGPAWVTLDEDHTAYKDDYDKLASHVDQKIEFPDHWDIAMFAFPDSDPDATAGEADPYDEGGGYWLGRSRCATGKTVDSAQAIHYTFVDPEHYGDSFGAHVTTIHELMHAFKLIDLYLGKSNRSYGWSVMSAAGAGWHITQYEKLLLGWEDPANFVFLKRGIVAADRLSGDIKGIVVLPADARPDTYFVEVAQEIGVGEAERQAFNKANENADGAEEYGLLVMAVRKDRKEGIVIPYVSERPANAIDTRERLGGASKAPFKGDHSFDTSGIFSYTVPAYRTDARTTVSRLIGIDGAFEGSDRAKRLRENDRLVAGQHRFGLSTTGYLDPPPLTPDGNPVPQPNVVNKDYGFVAYVDGKGQFHVAASVDDKPKPNDMLTSVPLPAGTALGEGKYYLKLEPRDGQVWASVYEEAKQPGGSDTRRYDLFKVPQIAPGYKQDSHGYTIIHGPDGNLVVMEGTRFKSGSYQQFDEMRPAGIYFDEQGTMTWLDEKGETLKTFSGTEGTGPFSLAVEAGQGAGWNLVVKDAADNTLYTVFGSSS